MDSRRAVSSAPWGCRLAGLLLSAGLLSAGLLSAGLPAGCSEEVAPGGGSGLEPSVDVADAAFVPETGTDEDPGGRADAGPAGDPGTPDTKPDTAPEDVPADVPDGGPADPCKGFDCPPGSVCKPGDGGLPVCLSPGSITETFDDKTFEDPAATTAAWGGGVLTVGAGDFGGSGKDGAFEPSGPTVVDTAENGGAFEYTTFVVPEGVSVTVVGPNPWSARVQGSVVVDGTIRSDGKSGLHSCGLPDGTGKPAGGVGLPGGTGGAGAGKGGDSGGGYGEEGADGAGPGGGGGSTGAKVDQPTAAAGAGGASFGSLGGKGVGKLAAAPGEPGPTYGDELLVPIVGGSGGGGGAGRDLAGNDGTCGPDCKQTCWEGVCVDKATVYGDGAKSSFDRPGGSGGGGGGAISISAAGTIRIGGVVSVNGGDGGWGDWSGAGGGGSGGAIRLRAWGEVVLDGGTLSAVGGKGGLITCSNQSTETRAGDGGDGRIRVESVTGLASGFLVDPFPPPSIGEPVEPLGGGSGADGPFEPASDTVLDADLGPFQFETFVVPAGVTVTAVGQKPLSVFSQATIEVKGTLDLSGKSGGTGYSACCGNPYGPSQAGDGGTPGPGGHPGGDGGMAGPGQDGGGPGGSPGGPVGSFSSAGGAGYAETGQSGGTNVCDKPGPGGGPPYGGPTLAALDGGSGGGGAGDSAAGACTWCQDGQCLSTNVSAACPAAPTCGGYCGTVAGACAGVEGCHPTKGWNPGSGGGGGGGAMKLQAPGLVRVDGAIRLNGGHAGDNAGASQVDDGTCGDTCTEGCLAGTCLKGGGSFGGSGGGGSGGALLIRAGSIRAEGLLEARGGESGELKQGGGCQVNPDKALPGQGRGGRGSPGRIRIETLSPSGSIMIGAGTFSRGTTEPSYGTLAQSKWYFFESEDAAVMHASADGAKLGDVLLVKTAPLTPIGAIDESKASEWAGDPALLPPGGAVRFRLELQKPKKIEDSSVVLSVQIDYLY